MFVHIVFTYGKIMLSIPDEIYRMMKRRREVKWDEVARQAITQKLEDSDGPLRFSDSTGELAKMIADAGVKLYEVSVDEAIDTVQR
jgi:hypothetical protein